MEKDGNVVLWTALLKPNELIKITTKKRQKFEGPMMTYSQSNRVNLIAQAGSTGVFVNSAAFNEKTNLLAVGFSHGVFVLCILPDLLIVHNFR